MLEVRPEVCLTFARGRALQIHDADYSRIEPGYIAMTSRFNQHGTSRIGELRRQLIDLRLKQRLAAGEFDQLAVILLDLHQYLIECHLSAAGERELRIAPTATQITSRCAHEHAR